MDALAYERQFVDHIAPVWRALPASVRGDFIVDPGIETYARGLGLDVKPVPRLNVDRGRPIPPAVVPHGPALVASYGDTKEARRFGYGPLAYIEHGIGQSYGRTGRKANGSYSGGTDRDDTTLFLVPGPDPAERWRAAYPDARVAIIGSPHAEELPARVPGPGPVVAVSFHWPAPYSVSPYAGTAVADYHPAIPWLAERWSVIGHAHPKGDWQGRVRRVFDRAGLPFVEDFAEVCRRADVYVCDNSSTIYEFAATGRPVVVLNASTWHRNGPELGLRFWAASHVGINVNDRYDLVAAVERALEDRVPDRLMREDALSKVYGYREGAADRAVGALLDWLGSLGQRVA